VSRVRVVATVAGYDRWAPTYDDDGNPTTALEERAFLAWLSGARLRGRRVLDLGCGTGRHALALSRRGAQVVGVDPSEGMLARAAAKPGARKVVWILSKAGERLPLRSKRFDAVVSALVLEHVAGLEGFFREARRVVRPGGELYVSAMHPAMLLRGSKAGFRDSAGLKIRPRGFPHRTADFVRAALAAGLRLDGLDELDGDAALERAAPRARKFRGWPMVLVLRLRRPR
jgi:malonyl-CoA O-methyltransferase